MHNTMYPGGFDKETGLSKVRMRKKRGQYETVDMGTDLTSPSIPRLNLSSARQSYFNSNTTPITGRL